MTGNPAVFALLFGSFITAALLGYASWHGSNILKYWDIKSGSEKQLSLERLTYLISSTLFVTLIFQIISLFLFIFTADALHSRLTGAMCAAGVLNANSTGYPLFLLKIINCLLAGIWLILNHADTLGYDYPLIKTKYAVLNILTPLFFLETLFQANFFLQLKPDIVTSCCGSLFSRESGGIAGEMAALPASLMQLIFFGGMSLLLLIGVIFLMKGLLGVLFSVLSAIMFPVAGASLVSFICLYFYELPTHHCPFCILQKEYGYAGYILYTTLLCAGVSGVGVGLLNPLRETGSLQRSIPDLQRRLAMLTLLSYTLFTVLVVWRMLTTSFRLG